MNQNLLSISIYLLISMLPISCEKVINYVNTLTTNEIKLVKEYKPYKAHGMELTLEELFTKKAGVRGDMHWTSFKPKGFEDRPDIDMVQIDITSQSRTSKSILVQYLVNKQTKNVEFYAGVIGNKPVSKGEIDILILMESFWGN